jgi:hypothetical protein
MNQEKYSTGEGAAVWEAACDCYVEVADSLVFLYMWRAGLFARLLYCYAVGGWNGNELIIVLVLCVRCDRILTDMSVGLTNNSIYWLYSLKTIESQ